MTRGHQIFSIKAEPCTVAQHPLFTECLVAAQLQNITQPALFE
jgi:hypothetical protein